MINEEKLDNVLLELGHNDYQRGTAQLRHAVKLWDEYRSKRQYLAMSKRDGLYDQVARVFQSTPSRVERAIRHSIETAWTRTDFDTQTKWFGGSVNPNTGKPTVGEYVARLARICHED